MKTSEDLLNLLVSAQPSWQKDGGGVQGLNRSQLVSTNENLANTNQPPTNLFSKLLKTTQEQEEIAKPQQDLPSSIFYVCINGQPYIATLYGTVAPMQN